MKKLALVFLWFIFLLHPGNAQEIERQVIGSAGGIFEGEEGSISWTIGEPVTGTFSNESNVVTQGFQQGTLKAGPVSITRVKDQKIHVYPNPVKHELTIESDNAPVDYKIIDVTGHLLLSGKIESTHATIDVSALPEGTYLLQLGENSIHQIIKQIR